MIYLHTVLIQRFYTAVRDIDTFEPPSCHRLKLSTLRAGSIVEPGRVSILVRALVTEQETAVSVSRRHDGFGCMITPDFQH